MVVNNVNNYTFANNKITLGSAFRHDVGQGRSYYLTDCVNVKLFGNTYTDAAPLTRVARSNNPAVWLRVNAAALRGKEEAK